MPQITNEYSIIVNSSDNFDDCWTPFFTLLKKYWPSCSSPIYLNTENKHWNFSGFDIHCTVVSLGESKHLSWSECLIRALKQIETPLVLYFQEDYFIHQPVRTELIDATVKYMHSHPEVKHIALTKHGSRGPYEEHIEDWLQVIPQKAKYRISTQAAMWRVDTLISYLEEQENGWMFEIFGTWRARRRNECFLSAKYDQQNGGPIIDYLHTGIIKGKWLPEIKNVFQQNDILIDYTKRGLYKRKPYFLQKIELVNKLFKKPIYFIEQFGAYFFDIIKIK